MKAFSAQALAGLANIHNRNLLHRDIKPGNFFIFEENGQEKLVFADLGFMKSTSQMNNTFLGTPDHMAPEIFARKKYN